jgi:predicted membrane-bound spermidine synthase
MPRNTIALIWAAGVVLALIVYVIGPDRFVFASFDLLAQLWWKLQDALRNISIAAFDFVRALAIGLYFVFVALTVLAIHRGGRGRGALVAVSLVFALLVWNAAGDGFGAHASWMAALALAGAGALTTTRRLTQPEPAPWQPGPLPPRHP